MERRKKVTTFLNDETVGNIGWDDALEKYKNMTVLEMLDLLVCETALRTDKDITMFRIMHTLQTITDKIRIEAEAKKQES